MAKKWGCYNRQPFRDTLVVQDGYVHTVHPATGLSVRLPRTVTTPFVNSRECHSGEGERCEGCSWLPAR